MSKYTIFKRIDSNDIAIIPYESNADHSINDSNFSDNGFVILEGLYTDNVYKNDILPISSSLLYPSEPINPTGYYKQSIHDSLISYYYNLDSYLLKSNNINLFLYKRANIISFPYTAYGEKIKEGSLKIKDYNNNFTASLVDDSYGNLYDEDISSENFVDPVYNYLYIGFNDKYNYIKYNTIKTGSIYDKKEYMFSYDESALSNQIGEYFNLKFDKGIFCSQEVSASGTQAIFNGENSYIEVEHSFETSLKDATDYAISFWGTLPSSQSDTALDKNVILSKRYDETEQVYNKKTTKLEYKNNKKLINRYPFEVGIYNSNNINEGKLYFKSSNGNVTNEVISENPITGSQHHFALQKTGSVYQLYIDGAFDTEITGVPEVTENQSNILIGSFGNNTGMLSGSLDEIRLYRKALTNDEISSLSNNNYISSSAYQTNKVGNVFYSEGTMLTTSPLPKYDKVLLDSSNFIFEYQSSITNYENNIVCRVGKADYNASLNPTLRTNNSEESYNFKDFVTSSEFKTYITQIGLYDDYGRLLAIGKVPHPIQNRTDVNLNFLIKFDS